MIAALLLLCPRNGDEPVPRGIPRLALHLGDGSRLMVAVPKDDLVLKTEYGEQRIPFGKLRFLRRLNDLEFAVVSPAVHATGEILADEFLFDSPLGRVRVPVRELRAVTGGVGASLFLDSNTVACWSFNDPSGGGCSDLVKNRPLTFQGMEVAAQPEGGSAGIRLNDAGYAEAASDESLEVAGGDFTLEARFKMGTAPRGYASIVSKNNKTNGQACDFLLYIQTGGPIHFQSVSPRGSFMWNIPGAAIKPEEWTYLAVSVQPEQQKIAFYVNGKPIHEIRQPFQFSSQGNPVFIGASPAYTSLGAPEKIQFVRISKVARTAEEIAEGQRILQNLPVALAVPDSRGLSLRDGAFLRTEFPKLAGACFRTRYGDVRLDEKSTGEIVLYRFRPGELPGVESDVKSLIEKLGEGGIAGREEARAKLLDLGEAAIPLLRKNAGDSDTEVRKRIEEILARLDEKGVASHPATDVLQVGGMVLHGWLDREAVEVDTRFGSFVVPAGSIERIRLGEKPAVVKPFLRLKSGERLHGELQRGSTLELDTGFGPLSIPIREILALTFDAGPETWTLRTDRVSAKGKMGRGELEIRSPVGRLKIPFSEIAEIQRKP